VEEKSRRNKPSLVQKGPSFFALAAIALTIAACWWYFRLPNPARFAHVNPERTALMRYREEKGIHGLPIWVPLGRIAPSLRQSVLVAEDANFYHHHGIDWDGLREALQRDWKEKRLYRGGSTITQQLAKNLYLNPSKTLWRKLKELALSLRIERALSKSRILEIYLNVAEWGRGVYGAEAASRHYFGKPASDLTIDEAAFLAAILPSPLRYEKRRDSPYIRKRTERIARFVERRLGGKPVLSEPVEPEPPEPPDLDDEPIEPSQDDPETFSPPPPINLPGDRPPTRVNRTSLAE
jgi:monofunctional biosynthetic peptidoglycan transglycosylase